MACPLFGAKALSEPILPYCQLDPKEHISVNVCFKIQKFSFKEMRNDDHLAQALIFLIWTRTLFQFALSNFKSILAKTCVYLYDDFDPYLFDKD